MTRFARVVDIIVRSFFMFIVFWLVFSYVFNGITAVLAVSFLITAGINIAFELTAGRKYWRAAGRAAAQNTGPKRKFRQAARDFFMRAFARNKTKGFVWAGTVILMLSFVVKLNVYYIAAACAVFIMAALTRFAPRRECVTVAGDGAADGEK